MRGGAKGWLSHKQEQEHEGQASAREGHTDQRPLETLGFPLPPPQRLTPGPASHFPSEPLVSPSGGFC